MFEGGPAPVYGLKRPDNEQESELNPVKPEEDEDWKLLVAWGGAGLEADSPEQQWARYSTAPEDSLELEPGLLQYQLRAPDIVITAAHDYTMKSWDPNDGWRQLQLFEGHIGSVNQVVPYRGNRIVSASDDFSIRMWKLGAAEYGDLELTVYVSDLPVKCVCVLPGERAACGTMDKFFRIVSLRNGMILHRFEEFYYGSPNNNQMNREGMGIPWCCLHLRDNIVVAGSDDSTIRFFDCDKFTHFGTHIAHQGWGKDMHVNGVEDPRPYKWACEYAPIWKMIHLGKGGDQMATCSYDRTIAIWDTSDIRNVVALRRWRAHENAIFSIALVSERHIVSIGADKDTKVWDFETMELVAETPTERGMSLDAMYFSPTSVAIAGGDAAIRIWDWHKDEEMLGDYGMYAHDFSICDIVGVNYEDVHDDDYWVKPIMYRSLKRDEALFDVRRGMDLMKKLYQHAVDAEWYYELYHGRPHTDDVFNEIHPTVEMQVK